MYPYFCVWWIGIIHMFQWSKILIAFWIQGAGSNVLGIICLIYRKEIFFLVFTLFCRLYPMRLSAAGVCCGPYNLSKWEADIWGWLEVVYTVNQCTEMRFASLLSSEFITAIVVNFPERKLAKRTSLHCSHWACRWYGHTGETQGWLGATKCHRQLEGG